MTLASTPLGKIVASGAVNIVQGSIELPYYLGVPSGTNGSPLKTESWNADNDLAAVLNEAFSALGLEIPQEDETVSDVVTTFSPSRKSTRR